MSTCEFKCVGFELIYTPLGDLAYTSKFLLSHPNFLFKYLADRYLRETPLTNMQDVCTIDKSFLSLRIGIKSNHDTQMKIRNDFSSLDQYLKQITTILGSSIKI